MNIDPVRLATAIGVAVFLTLVWGTFFYLTTQG